MLNYNLTGLVAPQAWHFRRVVRDSFMNPVSGDLHWLQMTYDLT